MRLGDTNLPVASDDRAFKALWRQLSSRDRLRVRFAVAYGRAVKDRRLAPIAVATARKWKRSVFVRNRVAQAIAFVCVVALLGVPVFLWVPEMRIYLPAWVLISAAQLMTQRRNFDRAESRNRELLGDHRNDSETR